MSSQQINIDMLQRLDRYPHREIYARISYWDISIPYMVPIQIEGRITGGSVNIDGNSSNRRSCSLTFAISNEALEFENDIIHPWLKFEAGLTNRFKLEVGLKNLPEIEVSNSINTLFPQVSYDANTEIFWFNQGEYVCSSYSYNEAINAVNISISGKDYMSLLNGELDGTLDSTVNFGIFEQILEDNSILEVQVPVVEVIKEAVHHYGKIPFNKIKIEEELLNTPGFVLKEYRYDKPLYLFRQYSSSNEITPYFYGTLNGKFEVTKDGETKALNIFLDDKDFDNLIPDEQGNLNPGEMFVYNGQNYQIHRIDFGETAGYSQTPLVYTGDLIAKPGESIESVIKKIKDMLGDYEYFFDFEGNFIFQKKAASVIYKNASIIKETKEYVMKSGDGKNYSISPDDGFIRLEKNTSFPKEKETWIFLNGANVSNTKVNAGFIVLSNNKQKRNWFAVELLSPPKGKVELKFTMAIGKANSNQDIYKISEIYRQSLLNIDDEEITEFLQSFGSKIGSLNAGEENKILPTYFNNNEDNAILVFLQPINSKPNETSRLTKIEVNNPISYVFSENKTMFTSFNNSYPINNVKNDFSIWGKRKGVAGANIDIHGRFALQEKPTEYTSLSDEGRADKAREEYFNKYHSSLTAQGGERITNENPGGWREVLYQMAKDYIAFNHTETYATSEAFQKAKIYQPYFTDMIGFWRQLYCPIDKTEEKVIGIEYDTEGWNVNISKEPWMLNFWIDFWEYKDTVYEKYSIPNIGHRPKVLNDSTVTAIQYDKIPELVFYEGNKPEVVPGKTYFNIPLPLDKVFSTSARGRSVFDAAESLKLNNIECIESSTVTSIPIYHLQPNTIVKIDEDNYLITRLTIPLAYNGTMNMTVTKIINTLPITNLVEYPNTGGK